MGHTVKRRNAGDATKTYNIILYYYIMIMIKWRDRRRDLVMLIFYLHIRRPFVNIICYYYYQALFRIEQKT